MKGVDVLGAFLEPTTAKAEGSDARGKDGAQFDALLAKAVEQEAGKQAPQLKGKLTAPQAGEAAPKEVAAPVQMPKSATDQALELPPTVRSIHGALQQKPALVPEAPANQQTPLAQHAKQGALPSALAELDAAEETAPAEPATPEQMQAMLEQVATVVARIVAPPAQAALQLPHAPQGKAIELSTTAGSNAVQPAPSTSVGPQDVAPATRAHEFADALSAFDRMPQGSASGAAEELAPQGEPPQLATELPSGPAQERAAPVRASSEKAVGAFRALAPTSGASAPSPSSDKHVVPGAPPLVTTQPGTTQPARTPPGLVQVPARPAAQDGPPLARVPGTLPVTGAPLQSNETLSDTRTSAAPAPVLATSHVSVASATLGTAEPEVRVASERTSAGSAQVRVPAATLPNAPADVSQASPADAVPSLGSSGGAPAQLRGESRATFSGVAASDVVASNAQPNPPSGMPNAPPATPNAQPSLAKAQPAPQGTLLAPANNNAGPVVVQVQQAVGEGASEVPADERSEQAGEARDRVHGFERGGWEGRAMSAYGGRGHEGGERGGERGARDERETVRSLKRQEERDAKFSAEVRAPEVAPPVQELTPLLQAQPQTPELRAPDVAQNAPPPAATSAPELPDVVFQGRTDPSAVSENASISLHHPDLGPIQLEVHRELGRVEVHAVIENHHAQAVLRANEHGIRQGVQQSGMTFSALRVRMRNEEQPTNRPGQERRRRNERES